MQTEIPPSDERHSPRYDRENDCYVFSYDPQGSATVTTTVVHALSTVAEIDVSQGEFSLYDSVDPDALERIFSSKADGAPRIGGYVAFTALDHEVHVHAEGDVYIYPPAEAPRPTADQ